MIRQEITKLEAAAATRPPGYLPFLYSIGTIDGIYLVFTLDAYLLSVKKYTPENYDFVKAELKKMIVLPVARPDWPTWAKLLAHVSTADDLGLGDTVHRLIGDETSATFKAWYQKTFGKPCGCTTRRTLWNTQYPLK